MTSAPIRDPLADHRDWARQGTVAAVAEIVLADRLGKE
jgi:hypothetical protein